MLLLLRLVLSCVGVLRVVLLLQLKVLLLLRLVLRCVGVLLRLLLKVQRWGVKTLPGLLCVRLDTCWLLLLLCGRLRCVMLLLQLKVLLLLRLVLRCVCVLLQHVLEVRRLRSGEGPIGARQELHRRQC